MKLIFMGTPEFAVPILRGLNRAHQVVAVVTQPDRPKGRGQAVQFSPVKISALEAGIPVLQPVTLRDKAITLALASYEADAIIVAAYGLMLPQRILTLPPLGCINVHASLLPKYRGAAPMQYALLNGDTVTGITVMHMNRGLDTGDIIWQRTLSILPGEHFPSLHDRMSALGCDCMLEALAQMAQGTAQRVPQASEAASYAAMIQKEDGHIHWQSASAHIINMTRALDPWPGAFTLYKGQPMKIWECESADANETLALTEGVAPGTLCAADQTRGLLVKTGDGAVWITALQTVGGRRMGASDYLRGHVLVQGTLLV